MGAVKLSLKPLYQWKEPESYVLYERAVKRNRPKPWLFYAVLVAVWIAGLFFVRYQATQDPTKNPLPLGQSILLIVGALAFLGCFFWLLSRLIGRSIRVYDKALMRQSLGQLLIPVETIADYSFEVVEEAGCQAEVVLIRTKRGILVTLGLSDSAQIEFLEKYFAERGVPPLNWALGPDGMPWPDSPASR